MKLSDYFPSLLIRDSYGILYNYLVYITKDYITYDYVMYYRVKPKAYYRIKASNFNKISKHSYLYNNTPISRPI